MIETNPDHVEDGALIIDETAPVITVDGPSGSGKGTLCQILANQLGWNLLDSGALYRLTALAAQKHGVALDDEALLEAIAEHLDVEFKANENANGVQTILEGEDVTSDIRTETVGGMASQVAAINDVRQALLGRQKAFQQKPGLIADGRDMGTVVFPQAPIKIFLTASAEARAERRYKQLIENGNSASLAAILEDVRARDERDTNRVVAPLKPAEDALVIDSTQMSIEEVVATVLEKVAEADLAS